MPIEELILNAIQGNIVYLLLAVLFAVLVLKAVRIVSQSEQHVIERFGRPPLGAWPRDQYDHPIP